MYDHAKHNGLRGLLSIIGGKLTTYRSLAEHAVDWACRQLGVRERARTATIPLPGAAWGNVTTILQTQGLHLRERYGLDNDLIDQLARLYGSQTTAVLATASPAMLQRLPGEQPLIGAQLSYALEHEQAHSLTDVFMRRTMTAYQPQRGLDVAAAAAAVLGSTPNWSDEQIAVAEYRQTVTRMLPRPQPDTVESQPLPTRASPGA
jgi:glycerol-3-phosphate dehydrogenase